NCVAVISILGALSRPQSTQSKAFQYLDKHTHLQINFVFTTDSTESLIYDILQLNVLHTGRLVFQLERYLRYRSIFSLRKLLNYQLFLRLYETWRHREKNFLQLKTGYCIPNWESVPGSVVCAYRLTDIEDAFRGPLHLANGQATKFESSGDKYTHSQVNLVFTRDSTESLVYDVLQLNVLHTGRLMFQLTRYSRYRKKSNLGSSRT
ncbi:hypothetical protein T265_13934, partial [Opisthorchis viverrini]